MFSIILLRFQKCTHLHNEAKNMIYFMNAKVIFPPFLQREITFATSSSLLGTISPSKMGLGAHSFLQNLTSAKKEGQHKSL